MNKLDVVGLTKKLISIPSWVDKKTNENAVGYFIFDYLKANSKLKVEKQILKGGRFNVIAKNNNLVSTLVVGHIDTVQPSVSWTKNPLKPSVGKGLLYGLGSSDMKSGVAVMLDLATNPKLKENIMFLFYADEEYDFLGMKGFVKKYLGKIKPKQIISFDGSDLAVTNGCRGLIEISITLKGKSGHAARPESGVNAITRSYLIINNLINWLGNYVSRELGPTTSNLAYIYGGQYQGEKNGFLILGKQGNVIADICRFTLDIRPSRPELTAKKIINFINRETKRYNLTLMGSSVRHDLGSWSTPKELIDLNGLKLPFRSAGKTGYIDVQMLWQNFNRIPCYTIGAGNAMAHKPDEYVEVKNIIKLSEIGKKLITNGI